MRSAGVLGELAPAIDVPTQACAQSVGLERFLARGRCEVLCDRGRELRSALLERGGLCGPIDLQIFSDDPIICSQLLDDGAGARGEGFVLALHAADRLHGSAARAMGDQVADQHDAADGSQTQSKVRTNTEPEPASDRSDHGGRACGEPSGRLHVVSSACDISRRS